MSRIRANTIVNGAGTGAPNFPRGAIISGISTINAEISVGTGTSISSPATNELALGTNDVERLRITSAGLVGIGTDNPTKALQISQNSDCAIRIDANNSNANARTWEIIIGGNASNNAEMVFRTRQDDGTGGSECARITRSGSIKLPSGGGIDFSATSDGSGTTTSELLDDYEEGTWTPTFVGAGGLITIGGYDLQEGLYTKIGNVVYIQGALRTTSVSGVSAGTYDIAGLPFTVKDGGSGVIFGDAQQGWTNGPRQFTTIENATTMRARQGLAHGASVYTNGSTVDFDTGSGSNNRVYWSGSYLADE